MCGSITRGSSTAWGRNATTDQSRPSRDGIRPNRTRFASLCPVTRRSQASSESTRYCRDTCGSFLTRAQRDYLKRHGWSVLELRTEPSALAAMSYRSIRMSRHLFVRRAVSALLLATLSLAITPAAVAAKVYRCGNTFQDLPCADVKTADTRPAERTPAPRDGIDCAQGAKEANGRAIAIACRRGSPATRSVRRPHRPSPRRAARAATSRRRARRRA